MTNSSKFICLKDAARISGYHQDYLGHLIRTGKLNGQKIGRSWMTTKSDLNDFLQDRAVSPVRGFVLSKFGMALMTTMGLALVVIGTLFVSAQFQSSSVSALDSHVEQQLNLSSADSLPISLPANLSSLER
jgi:hypothetical protein